MKRIIRIFQILLLFSGCFNYSFTGGGLPGINSISIPMADDKTNEFQLRENVTNALIDKFMRDGNLKLENINNSDSILRCSIQSISDRSASINRDELASQFELNIRVSIILEERSTGQELIKTTITGRSTYSDLSERSSAIEEAIDKLTSDILEEIISAW